MNLRSEELPYASVLMPVRNERGFIERSLGSVLAQDYPGEQFEILVVDGMSDDGTRAFVEELIAKRQSPELKLLDNPKGIVATALNIGTRASKGTIVLRVDGHCEIRPDHLRRCAELLEDPQSDVSGVGGPVETVSETLVGRAIAAAMSSRIGVGGSAFRVGIEEAQTSDTVPFPAYRHRTLEATGPYDEELVRNQDDEYNYRIRELGGQLLLDPSLGSRYFARGSLRKLWKQYYQYGYWKVRVLQKHPRQMSPRQFAPVLLVLALIATAVFGLVFPPALPILAVVPLAYLAGVLVASLLVSAREGFAMAPILPAAFAGLHLGYGTGFLMGLVRFLGRWGDKSTLSGEERLRPQELSEGWK